MLSPNELKRGVKFIFQGEPAEILEAKFLFKGRGQSVVQVKIKNLLTGSVVSKTFHPSETFEEADISKIEAKFLYEHREQYVFCQKEDPSKRFTLAVAKIGEQKQFLKAGQIVEGLFFEGEIINISLPIKLSLKVIEAPPGLQGDRAQAGTKVITLESGAKIAAPLFIKEGDVVEVNTETGQYVRRI
jgi:elongation factor P